MPKVSKAKKSRRGKKKADDPVAQTGDEEVLADPNNAPAAEEAAEKSSGEDATTTSAKKAAKDTDAAALEKCDGFELPPGMEGMEQYKGQEGWNAMLYQLLLYKAKFGDFNVSHDHPECKLLYNWVLIQKKHYRHFKESEHNPSSFLNTDRIAVLDAIDFQWNIRGEAFWQKNFDALLTYKKENGDCRVPRLYAKNTKLGEWVTDQRRQWKAKADGKPSMITDERKAKLDEVGFVWRVRDRADWNDRYEQLLAFKKENGHCVVPQHYTSNRALGKWVAKQREQYRFFKENKHSFLTEERIDLLKSVGFVWQIKGRGKKAAASAASPDEAMSEAVKTEEGGGEAQDDRKMAAVLAVEEQQAVPSLPQAMLPALSSHEQLLSNAAPALAAALQLGGGDANVALALQVAAAAGAVDTAQNSALI